MTSRQIAHRGTHAGEQPVDWSAERVQSGPEPPAGSEGVAARAARLLGWFSIGLGLAQLAAPRRVVSAIGAPVTPRSLLVSRLMGVREVAHGVAILSSGRPARWVWSRVAGDVLDLGLLGRALQARGSNRTRVAGALVAVAGTTAADVLEGAQLSRRHVSASGRRPMRVRAAVTISRSADDLYAYWRDLENLPDVMTHLQSVEDLGDGRSRWSVRGPLGSSLSWEAEVVEDVPGQLVAWRSLPGSTVTNSGELRFVPASGGRGTELHVLLRYEAPAARAGSALAKLLGDDPVQQVKDDLRRFKQVMETGEVVRSDGAPQGTDARLQPRQRPARPHEQRRKAR